MVSYALIPVEPTRGVAYDPVRYLDTREITLYTLSWEDGRPVCTLVRVRGIAPRAAARRLRGTDGAEWFQDPAPAHLVARLVWRDRAPWPPDWPTSFYELAVDLMSRWPDALRPSAG